MAKKKQYKKVSVHEIKRQELQKIYASPVKKKSKYTANEKRAITREHKKFKKILTAEEGSYKKVKTNKSNLAALKKMGYLTQGDKVFLDKQGYNNVRITTNPHFGLPVVERVAADKWVHQPIMGKSDILKFLEHYKQDDLPPGAGVTVSVGGASQFKRSYGSYSELAEYLKYGFKAKDDGASIENLMMDMELVYVGY